MEDSHTALHPEHDTGRSRYRRGSFDDDKNADPKDGQIAISSTSKAAGKMVAPFLAKHIPEQYNPLGGKHSPPMTPIDGHTNTKYCYRHRPDLKCRRQANEPTMDSLQHDLSALSKQDQQGITHVWSLFSAAPSKQRELMLQGILAQCCFPQLSMISASIRDLIKIDFLYALPPELGFKILCYLDTISLCKAAQVSRTWRALADDDVVWHKMCEQHIDRKCTKCGWGLPLLERKRLRTEKRQMQLRAAGRGLNNWSPNITPVPESLPGSRESSVGPSVAPTATKRTYPGGLPSPELTNKRVCTESLRADTPDSSGERKRPWKEVYKARFKVGTNWKYGRCRTRVFKGHTDGVMALQFDDNILATGSYDKHIRIWNIRTGECLRILKGHESGIRCLQFDSDTGVLMSGGLDKTIRVWNWRTGELLRTMTGHSGGIICINFAHGIIASGSQDHTVRVYDTKRQETYVLKDHTDWVNSVKLDIPSHTILTASDDCTVKLWDLESKQCIRTFEGHVGQVQQVIWMAPEFELDECDLAELASADGHDTDTDGDDAMVNDDPDNPWHDDQASGCHTASNPITPLFPGSDAHSRNPDRPSPPRYMLTGALDSTIRLWDVSTGKCLRTFFGHLEGIWALAADTLRVVSGAEDRMVKVWDPKTGMCESTFVGHAAPVTCIGLSDSRLVSGSEDCDVRVLEFGEREAEGAALGDEIGSG
ncbi:WD40 repeat-like protein [Rhizodiscina lignyota]|uniref:WD40 repeat-like protein n=1 Tax=Rhizodiscina lignyota TaxID=1504668 RepID=A0A9P4ITR8_9PEZI|nr:WD40 repeat-like protein [Rhizodiscina lignyota]